MLPNLIPIACVYLLLACFTAAQAATGQEVLEKHCSACHATANPMGGLDIRTREGLLRGGRRGPAMVPGES